jgi:hypothetical protein
VFGIGAGGGGALAVLVGPGALVFGWRMGFAFVRMALRRLGMFFGDHLAIDVAMAGAASGTAEFSNFAAWAWLVLGPLASMPSLLRAALSRVLAMAR